MQSACPGDLPSTPTGRLAAMRARVDAMLQAVQTVRPALDKFYASLSDEQKERFNALNDTTAGTTAAANVAQPCNGNTAKLTDLPVDQLEKSLRLTDAQDSSLRALNDATAKAAEVLTASCQGDQAEQALTPPGRVAAMEKRLKAMSQALETVQPALASFYGLLSDEQKARFDRLSNRRA